MQNQNKMQAKVKPLLKKETLTEKDKRFLKFLAKIYVNHILSIDNKQKQDQAKEGQC